MCIYLTTPYSNGLFTFMARLASVVSVLLLALCMALPAVAVEKETVTAKELDAYKELQQVKLDAVKEVHQRDVEALNKRIDDQLAQVGQGVDRFGVMAAVLGTVVSLLLAGLGLIGYITVSRKTKVEAEQAARDWFTANEGNLKQRLSHIEQDVTKHAEDVHGALDRMQALIGAEEQQVTEADSVARADMVAVQERAEELKKSPEASYSFEDWNTRAHAAYSRKDLQEAAYRWHKAAEIPNAGAANVAQALLNKAVAQGQLNQSEAAIATYDEVTRRFGDATEAALREQVAKALVNKGITQGQLNQSEAAIATYDEVIRRFGDASEAALREMMAKACNNKGFAKFLSAKACWDQDQPQAHKHLSEALLDLNKAVEHSPQLWGMALGNRSYVRYLQGDAPGAETDFALALRAEKFGGKALYKGTLKDFDLHPISEDAGMRELVKRLWVEYQAEQKGKPQ